MAETPLDLEEHKGDTAWQVWRRRLLFVLMIGLCVAFAVPTFGSCSGALGPGSEVWGTFRVGGEEVSVRESDFRRASERIHALLRFMRQDQRLEDEQIWAVLIQDGAARDAGIHVSDEQVEDYLRERLRFERDGRFDRERYAQEVRTLAQSTGVDHEGLSWAIRTLLRTEVFMSVWAAAYDVPESRAAFEEWRSQNAKLTVDYVVQPYEALREKARSLPVTDDDLKRIAHLPRIVEMCTVPARRGLEAAYVRVRDLTPEHLAAMRAFVKDAGIRKSDHDVENAAWNNVYWGNHEPSGPFSKESWLRWKGDEYRKRLAEWESIPEPRPEKPKDPAEEEWPARPQDQFEKRWKDVTTAEALAQDVVRHLAERAERENVSFASLLPEYGKLGVRVVATAEPLRDDDLAEKFPDGLGKDSDLDQAVRTKFRLPEAGAQFVPKVIADPVLTTRATLRVEDRGWFVLRWTSLDPARVRDVLELREEATRYYRDEYRVSELARDALAAVRKPVDEAEGVEARREALRKSAAAAGLEVETARRFNSRTEKRTEPTLGTDASEATRAAAARIRHRNRVIDAYQPLSRLEAGAILDPVLLDEPSAAAYLMVLVEKHQPEPIEMDESTLRSSVLVRRYQSRNTAAQSVSPKELRRRYRLELTPEGRKSTSLPATE